MPRFWIFITIFVYCGALPGSAQLAWAAPPDSPEYVQRNVRTLDDFWIHTQSHIRRVERLGQELIKLFPDEFKNVDPELLRQFLLRHDQSKVNGSVSFVSRFHPPGAADRRPILARLYSYYGIFEELNEEEKKEAQALVQELNEIDSRVARDFFKAHGLEDAAGNPSTLAKSLLRIEKLSDFVDRYRSPVSAEEFHKKMKPASEFLKDPSDRKLAEALERQAVYDRATRGFSFPELRLKVLRSRCIVLSRAMARLRR